MLIDNSRITKRDKELWEELLDLDRLHAATGIYKKHEAITGEMIKKFIDSGKPYYVAVSWGKDSVVLADMFCRMGAKCKFVYIRNLAREPDGNTAVRDNFLKRHSIDYEEICYDYADADETYYDRSGNPHKWQNILKDLQKKHGCHVTGIRYDESAKRKRRFIFMGIETVNSFAPFRYFTVFDIFAYLLINDLPIHPNYAMLGGGRWDKYHIRVAAIGNKEGDGMGRTEWEREYYPDILTRIDYSSVKKLRGLHETA